MGGFPLIYRQGNLTIDGYTQGTLGGGGTPASANTNPITAANNAVIQIVIDGRNNNRTDMRYRLYGTTVFPVPTIDNTYMSAALDEVAGLTGTGEAALLGIYRSTNVTVRGLAFLASVPIPYDANIRTKGIVIEMDYDGNAAVLPRNGYTSGSSDGCHINGCWFGVNPANPTVAGSASQGFRACVTSYRHNANNIGPRPQLILADLTVGVKKGSLNPRAEFNVMAGPGGFLSLDVFALRLSGNFISVLPDGVTPFNWFQDSYAITNASSQWRGGWVEVGGRQADDLNRPMVIGTDGDGVNDADEGNLFGSLARQGTAQQPMIPLQNPSRVPYIIAGNRFGIGVDGTIWTNNCFYVANSRPDQGTQMRFGSDFNGVSDALEANIIYNNNEFGALFNDPPNQLAKSLFRVVSGSSGQQATTDSWFSFRGNKSFNNFALYVPGQPGDTDVDWRANNYLGCWSNYIFQPTDTLTLAAEDVPVLSGSSTLSTLIGTCGLPNNDYTNLVVDVYAVDPDGEINGALFDRAYSGGTAGWGFVQGTNHLGAFLDNGPYDSNPAVGDFSFDISGLGLASGTKVTIAVTYSTFARPLLASPVVSGDNVTLSWTGDNGGPYNVPGQGGPTSGFGVQSSVDGGVTWTTTFAPNNSIVLPTTGNMTWYRVIAPLNGMTTLCAPPVTL